MGRGWRDYERVYEVRRVSVEERKEMIMTTGKQLCDT